MMIRQILGIINFLIRQMHAKLWPIHYARSLGVQLGRNVRFYGMRANMFSTEPWLITIGDNVFITAGCQFITHDGGTLILRKQVPDLDLTGPIEIGSDVYIGLNTTILPNVTIGSRVIIGAGSVVTKSIPGNSVAAGVPARVLSTVDAYLEKAVQRSTRLGHLQAREKEVALRKLFNAQNKRRSLDQEP